MPALSRKHAGKLLRVVKGQAHASKEDHEEGIIGKSDDVGRQGQVEKERLGGKVVTSSSTAQRSPPTIKSSKKPRSQSRISASPMSSEDEAPSHSPRGSPTITAPTTSKSAKMLRERKQASEANNSRASKRTSKAAKSIKVPKAGAYQNGRAERDRRDRDENKENISSMSSQPSSGKRPAEEDDRVESIFGMGDASSAPKRQRISTAPNIFAPAATTGRKTFGKKTFGKAAHESSRSSRGVPTTSTQKDHFKELEGYAGDGLPPAKDDDDASLSDVSMVGVEIPPPKKPKKTNSENREELLPTAQKPKRKRANLADLVGDYGQDSILSSQTSATDKNTLPNLDPSASSNSTPLSSLGDDTPEHMAEDLEPDPVIVSSKDAEDVCPLCQSTVDPEHYREFWSGTKMTVRQQTLFCHEHKKREALEQYDKQGYPTIDWNFLPNRIQEHRRRLLGIVHGEFAYPSQYRDGHAARMEAGERRTLRKQMQESDFLDTKTGYYGSRGRRVMMESITASLGDDIREVSKNDPVVTYSGISDFVLRVLVPELTICLVKDDFKVSDAMAKQTIEESGDLGLLVNEEVEDVLDNMESEDEEM